MCYWLIDQFKKGLNNLMGEIAFLPGIALSRLEQLCGNRDLCLSVFRASPFPFLATYWGCATVQLTTEHNIFPQSSTPKAGERERDSGPNIYMLKECFLISGSYFFHCVILITLKTQTSLLTVTLPLLPEADKSSIFNCPNQRRRGVHFDWRAASEQGI